MAEGHVSVVVQDGRLLCSRLALDMSLEYAEAHASKGVLYYYLGSDIQSITPYFPKFGTLDNWSSLSDVVITPMRILEKLSQNMFLWDKPIVCVKRPASPWDDDISPHAIPVRTVFLDAIDWWDVSLQELQDIAKSLSLHLVVFAADSLDGQESEA